MCPYGRIGLFGSTDIKLGCPTSIIRSLKHQGKIGEQTLWLDGGG
jgi:hypothetical protein